MSNFTLKKLAQVRGKIRFNVLEIDGRCQFEEFCAEIEQEGNLNKQLVTIFARMDQIANMQLLPVQKFRDITPKKEIVKEFDIKTSDLRIYLIKEQGEGQIVIWGGKKNTQVNDIAKFRSIKQRYLQSKKTILWLSVKNY